MAFERKQSKWDWREYLTDYERETLAKADEAKAIWSSLNGERASITNRAIQRARYAAAQGSTTNTSGSGGRDE